MLFIYCFYNKLSKIIIIRLILASVLRCRMRTLVQLIDPMLNFSASGPRFTSPRHFLNQFFLLRTNIQDHALSCLYVQYPSFSFALATSLFCLFEIFLILFVLVPSNYSYFLQLSEFGTSVVIYLHQLTLN